MCPFLSDTIIRFIISIPLFFSDIEKIQAGIGDKAALFLQALSTFIAGFVIGYVVNWKLALVVSIMLPMLVVITACVAKVVS